MEALILEYKKHLKETRLALMEFDRKINIAKLISEDEGSLQEQKIQMKNEISALEKEKSIYSGMKSDLEYAISWMTTGRRPASTRGIERRAAYQKERPFDPIVMQKYFRSEEPVFEWDDHKKESLITPSEREIIELALINLTAREREMYLMSKGQYLTQYDIADKLGLSRNSVKTTLSRANKKIARAIIEIEREGAM